jgi:peptidoglycan/LPS O-acetylase OafA/YrhL
VPDGAAEAKIVEIKVLRAIAILLVLASHLSVTASVLSYAPVGVHNPGWIGVGLFFVMSGYFVSRSLLRMDFAVVPFLIRRAFRLYPLASMGSESSRTMRSCASP